MLVLQYIRTEQTPHNQQPATNHSPQSPVQAVIKQLGRNACLSAGPHFSRKGLYKTFLHKHQSQADFLGQIRIVFHALQAGRHHRIVHKIVETSISAVLLCDDGFVRPMLGMLLPRQKNLCCSQVLIGTLSVKFLQEILCQCTQWSGPSLPQHLFIGLLLCLFKGNHKRGICRL